MWKTYFQNVCSSLISSVCRLQVLKVEDAIACAEDDFLSNVVLEDLVELELNIWFGDLNRPCKTGRDPDPSSRHTLIGSPNPLPVIYTKDRTLDVLHSIKLGGRLVE